MSFEKLDQLGRRLEALEHALAILSADEATHMAVGGGEKRAEALAVWRALEVAAVEEDAMPSRRGLAEALGIPRGRMAELFGVVGRVLADCRRALGLARDEEGR